VASGVERHLRARGIASLTTEALNDARKDSAGRYRGDVGINLTHKNMQNQRMVFIPVRPGTVLGENDYRISTMSYPGSKSSLLKTLKAR
jgi:hypothetical protein